MKWLSYLKESEIGLPGHIGLVAGGDGLSSFDVGLGLNCWYRTCRSPVSPDYYLKSYWSDSWRWTAGILGVEERRGGEKDDELQ